MPNNEEILKQLKKITSSSEFRNSPRSSSILRYIVEQSLAGNQKNINGITIAQDVFDRGADFDSSIDSIVRVSARRLRQMLSAYYSTVGVDDNVRISMPRGSYRPAFETRSVPSKAETKAGSLWRGWKIWAAVICVFSMIGTISLLQFPSSNEQSVDSIDLEAVAAYPVVYIFPFENMTSSKMNDDLSIGLQRQLAEDLRRFRTLRIIAPKSKMQNFLMQESQSGRYTITGMILDAEDAVDLMISVFDVEKNEAIIKRRVTRSVGASGYFDILLEISSQITNEFAGHEGILVKQRLAEIEHDINHSPNHTASLTGLHCLAKFHDDGIYASAETYMPVYKCLKQEVAENPQDATFLSAFAWVMFVGTVNENESDRYSIRETDPKASAKAARSLAEQAIILDPTNDTAHIILGSIKMQTGDLEGALLSTQRALNINRANPETLAFHAKFLSFDGNWKAAVPFAQESIARQPEAPSTYYWTLLIDAFLRRDVEAIRRYENKATPTGIPHYDNIFLCIAASIKGDKETVASLRPKIIEFSKEHDDDPLIGLRPNLPSLEIITMLEMELERNDIPIPINKRGSLGPG